MDLGNIRWMVDCNGDYSESCDNQTVDDTMQSLDFESFINRQGALAQAIQKTIQDHGYTITDRGGGRCAWHIGVPFSELADAVAYLELMTGKFSQAIRRKMIWFSLKTWSPGNWA